MQIIHCSASSVGSPEPGANITNRADRAPRALLRVYSVSDSRGTFNIQNSSTASPPAPLTRFTPNFPGILPFLDIPQVLSRLLSARP